MGKCSGRRAQKAILQNEAHQQWCMAQVRQAREERRAKEAQAQLEQCFAQGPETESDKGGG